MSYSGESQYSLSRQFRVGHSTVNGIIHSTCAAIYDVLKGDMLVAPNCEQAWLDLAQHFNNRWQFPNCVGGIDGKHVVIVRPAKSGTLYYNYKKTYSVILFALVDADCKFAYIDVGTPGSKGDGAIWQTTPLQKAITEKRSGLPDMISMNASSTLQLPPVIVGDDAFPLSPNLMKPFGGSDLSKAQKIFNYRLSRARRVAENAFGILAHRFRFLLTTVHATPERVSTMVKAACVLHNLLKRRQVEQPETSKGTAPEKTFFGLESSKSRAGALAAAVRERLCEYFSREGAVPWQDKLAGIDISHLRRNVT
ncbi:putative nuclease HARBI1 [Ixodes scapularis]|uniref:putative nuclease HARBI1 n=1 Tax=Ixodes scapularis TaxID=6945 RepID=UPI001A9EC830|nr:putative nuclease HARBI1 [Ixodes scapularis]